MVSIGGVAQPIDDKSCRELPRKERGCGIYGWISFIAHVTHAWPSDVEKSLVVLDNTVGEESLHAGGARYFSALRANRFSQPMRANGEVASTRTSPEGEHRDKSLYQQAPTYKSVQPSMATLIL